MPSVRELKNTKLALVTADAEKSSRPTYPGRERLEEADCKTAEVRTNQVFESFKFHER